MSTETGAELYRLFSKGWDRDLRTKLIEEFGTDDVYKKDPYWSIQQYRRKVVERLKKIIKLNLFSVYDYEKNPIKFMTFLRVLLYVDYSTSIKAGVHFTLCGGSIISLGTKKHHKYLDALNKLEIVGSLAMTELGHGSNVSEVETTATYDANSGEFVIHSPTETSQLNGVDNGRIWFNNVRIPRENLLDKYCSVASDGKYASPIKNPSVRFATMIGGLVGGRVLIAAAAVDGSKIALNNAIRFSYQRKQFGSEAGKEVPIMSYITHQRRLIPAVATTYAIESVLNKSADLFAKRSPQTMKQVHLFAAGVKVFATWHRAETASNCRQCCGGQGFSAYNKISDVITDMDVDTTFEGDNTVLAQQITKSSLATYATRLQKGVAVPTVDVPAFDLNSIEWFKLAFKKRDFDQLKSLADAIHHSRMSGLSEFDSFNINLDLGLKSAWATIERMAFASLVEVTEGDISSRSKSLLLTCARLFALERMERDLGYFVASGTVAKHQFLAIRNEINKICDNLYKSGDLLTLLDGFDLPDITLAPIAKNFVEFYSLKSKF